MVSGKMYKMYRLELDHDELVSLNLLLDTYSDENDWIRRKMYDMTEELLKE